MAQRNIVGEPLRQPGRHRGERRLHRDMGALVAEHHLRAPGTEVVEDVGVEEHVHRRAGRATPVDRGGDPGDDRSSELAPLAKWYSRPVTSPCGGSGLV